MPFFSQSTNPPLQTFGVAGLATLAVFATTLFTRRRYARATSTASVRRRLGLPKGVARWLVVALLILVVMIGVGVDLQGLWLTLVPVLSLVAIGFVAMWSILSHMLASVLILIFRPFEVGDRVEILGDDAVLGEVTDLNPVYTTLRADDGGTLQVPNNLFFQKALKRHASPALNYPRPPSV